ncbi:MAG: flagellar biosynthetic protein FliR [Acidobacteriota bacterium]
MGTELPNLTSLAAGFALVSARVTGAFYFIPFPGPARGATMAKVVMILAITFSLYPLWPLVDPNGPLLGLTIFGILKEAAVGSSLGLVVALAGECFSFCFHLLGLQAGYSFASTIDPTSQADSTVLESLGHLAGGLLFFTTGLHYQVIRAFAISLEMHPAGTWTLGAAMIPAVLSLFQAMLSAGVRLALPVMASLVLIDLALALASRITSHLQLVMLAFPLKMITSLLLIVWLLQFLPAIFTDLSTRGLAVIRHAMML